MIDQRDKAIVALPEAAGLPIIRRDTNTIVVQLSEDEILTIIGDMAHAAALGGIYLVVESDNVHLKET